MEERKEEMKKIYDNLTEENKNVLNMVAKGIEIGQHNSNVKVGKNND